MSTKLEGVPPELKRLFRNADEALFELHREMERSMARKTGKENWREVYALRVALIQRIRPMCENNFGMASGIAPTALPNPLD